MVDGKSHLKNDLCFLNSEEIHSLSQQPLFVWDDAIGSILDCSMANGAHPFFLNYFSMLWNQCAQGHPIPFSAWNTNGNRLGTFFSVKVLSELKLIPQEQLNAFEQTLLIDQILFQSDVRSKLNQELQQEGKTIWNLQTNENARLEKRLLESARFYSNGNLDLKSILERVELPWNRTFEVHCELKRA
jgi:hypothetical protein